MQEDLVHKMSPAELSKALEERGMRPLDAEINMRKALKYWLSFTVPNNNEEQIPYGLLVFSRMFLLNSKYE